MFTVLLTIAKIWKPPMSTDKDDLVYAMEYYYSAMKNKTLSFVPTMAWTLRALC